MPLERFIPKSPDPFIRNSQDFEVAKFGHLNTIIEYVNTYVVTDSLQLSGTGPLTSTARYITDSLGNASSLAISSGNIGIGTTNATARLRVISADTNGIVDLFQLDSSASPLHLTRYGGNVPINLNASGGTSTSPTPLGNGTAMSRISTNTYNGTAFGTSARIEVVSKGIQSATNYGSNMRFFVTAENAISTSEVLTILSSGNVQINESFVTDRNAKLFIKGSGSTSATTSLLVQNSGGSESLRITDDRVVKISSSAGATALNVDFGNVNSSVKILSHGSTDFTELQIGSGFLLSRNGGGDPTITSNTALGINATQIDLNSASNIPNKLFFRGNYGLGSAYFGAFNTTNPSNLYFQNGTTPSAVQNVIATFNLWGVSDNATVPTLPASSMFSLASTTRGFLAPRMTTAQRDAIVSPATGLQVFNTSLGTLDIYDGTGWDRFGSQTLITGAGSTSATTSLLVQNSGGTQSLKVTDSGLVNVGDYASNFGALAIPFDGVSFGTKPFIVTQRDGTALLSMISNTILEISAPALRVQPIIRFQNVNTGLSGPDAQNINQSSILLSGAINAYNGTSQNDACNLVYIENRGSTLQAAGSINWIKMAGNVYEAGGGGNKWCTGIYYNPTFTGGTLLANSHYCYHATSGQMMVNTTSPNASAQLQVDSTTRGFLPPRMTTAQRTGIVLPAAGLIVYDTDTNKSYTYDGTAWQAHY